MSAEDAKKTIDDHSEQMIARLPGQHQDAVNLQKLLTIYGDRVQALEDIAQGIRPEVLFDIETAATAQLDQIGTLIGLPRDERDNAAYVIVLRTQALLILSDRRTQGRLMEIVRSLLDTPAGTIGYTEFSPKSYSLSVPSATLDQLISWIPLLRRTRPITYNVQMFWTQLGHFDYQDQTGTIPVPGADVSGYADASGTISESWGGMGAVVDF